VGTRAEWIVERPCLDCGTSSYYFPDLSDYGSVQMSDANFLPIGGTTMIPFSEATDIFVNALAYASQFQQLTMTGSDQAPSYDNNVLSTASGSIFCPSCITFTWQNFH
jgi:hypothetical protein